MTKIYIKLIAMSLALILSVSVVVMSSYAWLVLSGNPVATGINVAIGGGNTILMAPNVQLESDNKTYNIPGRFSDKMNFGQSEHYQYLKELGNLTPVSTSNGIDWILPAYYSGNDELVQQGKVPSGALKDISEFQVDSFLNHANLPASAEKEINKGSYIYLDFWVVSPGGDYTLRVSTGEGTEAGGSFVIDMPQATNDGAGYVLDEGTGGAAATVRVGFLANDLMLTDDTMLKYQNSPYRDNRFTALKGIYAEPDSGVSYSDADRFTIYEPNADHHPFDAALDGNFVQTKTLEWVNGAAQEREENSNVTVQTRSTWAKAGADTDETALEQRFQTSLVAFLGRSLTAEEQTNLFYNSYLQGQLSTHVEKGQFVRRTANLNSYMTTYNGKVPVSILEEELPQGGNQLQGATDDVYIIKLERNVPQRLRMFIWLEGQDVDCVDKIHSSRFAVNIELAGGDQ